MRQFRAEFPKVSLGVMEGFSGHVLEWLTTGRIDVAVLYNAPRTSAHPLIEAGRIRKWSIVDPTMTRSLVVATSTQRPVTKAARALVGFVRKQVDMLVEEERWAPKR